MTARRPASRQANGIKPPTTLDDASQMAALKAASRKAARAGAPPSDQDPQRRLGAFEGKGEPSKKGSRSAGIVGQKKQRFSSANKKRGK
ncbi:MAG: hypothetical protein KF774_10945 [Planctomyces sp.]|nr:hypothetical protein [Planctomyces sp.]